ncbi:hypothetical protein MUJ63_02505 [Lachnospiraceae bacterium NSJ-143]|nr:hypothetical protein [Lachnospiraceae bacterium NSJ-143]
MRKIIALVFVFAFVLSGCGGNEIEGRNFVSVMGIDDAEGENYNVTLGFITPDGEDMYTAQAKSIETPTAAVTDKLISSGKRQMYFGHLKAIVVGKDALYRPEPLNEILSMSSSDSDISMDTIILASERKASDIVSSVSGSGDGLYVWDFYKNNKNRLYSSQKLTLAEAVKQNDTQNGIVIPMIDADDENIDIQGGIICTGGLYSGKLDTGEMQGFIYLCEDGKGKTEVISVNSKNIPFEIKRNVNEIKFFENGGKLSADIDISVKAHSLNEYDFDIDSENDIAGLLEGQIERKAESAADKLQSFNCDALGLGYSLMREDSGLYDKYSQADMFKNMDLNINVSVFLE